MKYREFKQRQERIDKERVKLGREADQTVLAAISLILFPLILPLMFLCSVIMWIGRGFQSLFRILVR